MSTGIYTIESPTNKVYVGQSTDLKHRERQYSWASCKSQRRLYNSIQKHGWENHVFNVIMPLREDATPEQLVYWEQFFIDFYRNQGIDLLNLRDAGSVGKMSEESKDMKSIAMRGKRGKVNEEQVKLILAELNKGTSLKQIVLDFNINRTTIADIKYGRTWDWLTGMSLETGKLLPKNTRIVSSETRSKMSRARMGKKYSEETKQKMRNAFIKRPPLSKEVRAKIGKSLLGRKNGPPSEETKRKIGLANKGRKYSGRKLSPEAVEILHAGRDNHFKTNSKINAENIISIVQRIRTGESCKTIAKDIGVSRQLISGIKFGRNWSSLTGITKKIKLWRSLL